MRNQLQSLYESEGYRVESMKADGERAQVTMRWDRRFLPRCGQCGKTARINRTTVQSALDLPLGPTTFVGLVYEAVQGHCAPCARYETGQKGQGSVWNGTKLRSVWDAFYSGVR